MCAQRAERKRERGEKRGDENLSGARFASADTWGWLRFEDGRPSTTSPHQCRGRVSKTVNDRERQSRRDMKRSFSCQDCPVCLNVRYSIPAWTALSSSSSFAASFIISSVSGNLTVPILIPLFSSSQNLSHSKKFFFQNKIITINCYHPLLFMQKLKINPFFLSLTPFFPPSQKTKTIFYRVLLKSIKIRFIIFVNEE